MRIITLTTDFGLNDWFAGTMKGVVFGVNPQAQIADITHGISMGDIPGGAFALAASYAFFPKGTIHVAVVDPGVGTGRSAIAVVTKNYVFIGPDNGVLSLAVAREKISRIHRLENRQYFRASISNTFHGRDIFAPVAAHISLGMAVSRLGPVTGDFVKLTLAAPRVTRETIRGEVIYIDRFGNATTNIRAELFQGWPADSVTIMLGKTRISGLSQSYQGVKAGRPLAIINSASHLEIAVNRGNAARQVRLKVGSAVVLGVGVDYSNKPIAAHVRKRS